MPEILLKDQKIVGNYKKPYIIAEVNSSHNGSIETAKAMIKEIKDAGCDCVKFQSWSTESLYSKSYYDQNPIAKRIVGKFAISESDLEELARYSKEIGIAFASTPYSKAEVDVLVDKIHVPFVKIASMEINNHDFLTYIAQKGVPVILSTGMADMEEIRKAVKTIENAGNKQIIILHCVSIYPAAPATINLNNIVTLQKEFPEYVIGYSDHTLGTEVSSASIVLGSAVIEKHFTLDKSKMGMDNNMAIEPAEMKDLVTQCHNVYQAMGSAQRVVSEAEKKQRINMRRSIIVVRDMKKGEVIARADLDVKRPGNGLAPEFLPDLVGKTLVNDVNADCLILENDIK